MRSIKNRQFLLARRPEGIARLNDFQLVETSLPSLKHNDVQFRNILISVDPYQRNLMGNGPSELPSIDLNTPMSGPTIGIVEQSNNADFSIGDYVVTWSGWQERGISDGQDLRKLDPNAAPVSTALGVLGHTGLTAWVGLTKIIQPKVGGTLVVTSAAGSVGSVAAQIARLRGLRVVGIAGGPEKVKYLTEELGLDEAVDYKSVNLKAELERVLPEGIDTLFDNVGGEIFESLMPHFNAEAKVVICGTITGYNDLELPKGPNRLPQLLNLFLYRFIEVRGFSLPDHLSSYPDFLSELTPWVTNGKIKYQEDYVTGFENIPETFLRLFSGSNKGKLIVRVD